ncbi:folic acid binding [Actinidia rufa]|uniref:Folic acid binding n=1 Tax=Actinidia rufa TaxID=165716 RepID=A0A7J0GQ22_9ERIC|nr:folic acid binding [Actinidia rufa]
MRLTTELVTRLHPCLQVDTGAISRLVSFKEHRICHGKVAFEAINLELHCGSHPQLGVLDHICFHTLGCTSMDQTAGIAKSLAADIGSTLQVPTFLYGAAHTEGRTSDSIRRELGYFKPNFTGNQWAGGPKYEPLPPNPDDGPAYGRRCNLGYPVGR